MLSEQFPELPPQLPNNLPTHLPPQLNWQVHCNVIDNYGDVGVAWRLCCDLAGRGQHVQLHIDDASALAWMAPQGCPGVEVVDGRQGSPTQFTTNIDVFIECFGCNIDNILIANLPHFMLGISNEVLLINLEYLSAENYALRNHGLASPLAGILAQHMAKFFFYPGFVPGTGGLLREPTLAQRQANFNRLEWLQWLSAQCVPSSQFDVQASAPVQIVSLFCYEPSALPALLQQWANSPHNTRLLVTHGRASHAVQAALTGLQASNPSKNQRGSLSISYLPALTQIQYDALLWASDLNFVRGEDSLVRALWAGKPFVWHVYPQDDNAHHAKLAAFLQWLQADAGLTAFHQAWNAASTATLPTQLPNMDLPAWGEIARQARNRLLLQPDLCSQLLDFVAEKRKSKLK